MAAATAPARRRTPARNGTKPVNVTPDDFRRIETWLTTNPLVERNTEVAVMNLCALAGKNLHLVGLPGIAKSLGLREYAKCIPDAIYFEKALNGGLPPEAALGGWDFKRLLDSGDMVRALRGLAVCHIGFLDEEFRANGLMLDALLPIENTGERHVEVDFTYERAELRFLVSASNHMPDADNEMAQALVDRKTLIIWVEAIKSDDSWMDLIGRAHDRTSWGDTRETITLAQLDEAQRQVRAIYPKPEFKQAAAQLRTNARTEGLDISDRRWLELYDVCRGGAWLAGRDCLLPDDLVHVEHGLARDPDDRAKAHALVLPYHGRFEREASEKRTEAADSFAEWEEIKPLVEGTPAGQDLDPNTIRRAMRLKHNVVTCKERVDALVQEAAGEQRDASKLRALSNELLAVQQWLKRYDLPSGL